MSTEQSPTQFVDAIKAVLEPTYAQLEIGIASPEIQTYLDCAFPVNPTVLYERFHYFRIPTMRRQAHATHDIDAEATILGISFMMTDESSENLRSHTTSQEKSADEISSENWSNVLKWLKRGPEKIMKDALDKGVQYASDAGYTKEGMNASYEMSLPTTFMLIAFEALEAKNNNYEASMAQFQTDAQLIQAGRRVGSKKPQDDIRVEVYNRAMSILGTYYNQPKNNDFAQRFFKYTYAEIQEYFGFSKFVESYQPEGDMRVRAAYAESESFASDVLRHMAAPFDLSHLDFEGMQIDHLLRFTNKQYSTKHLRQIQQNMGKMNLSEMTDNILKPAVTTDAQAELDRREVFQKESQRVLIARGFIDAIADGRLDLRAVQAVRELLDSKPLQARVKEEMPQIEWEKVIRPGAGAKEYETGVDSARVEKLYEYIRRWGEGDIERSRIPDTAEDEQYYVATLPQQVGNIVLEHAIGDHTEIGRNAVYMWRAELGLGLSGRPIRSWREVFSAPNKKAWRELGAKAILHTDNLDDKITEYLTRPTALLKAKRYFFK